MAFRFNPLTSQLDLTGSGSSTPDATTLIKGKLQLAGDLAGTASLPLIKRQNLILVAPSSYTGPADYTCTGITNNEVTINLAMDQASTLWVMSGYSVAVELLAGDYYIGARVIPKSYVWFRGQGMFASRLHATTALTAGMLDNKAEYNTANPYIGGIISDMELDGSGMSPTQEKKGFNSDSLNNCKVMRLYVHDTNATGIGPDDFYGSTITECIVMNCGYMNKKILTAAAWSTNTVVFTSNGHGYSINDVIVTTGMIPTPYNGRFVISAVTTNTFTITSSFLDIDPGAATTFGMSSDSLIGHNGIGIASGANTHEATIVTNNICIGNQNNNFLIEADTTFTDANASYIFANNISVEAGQCGYLNTGSPNTQFVNNYDYGSQFGCQVAPVTQVRTITAASWSGGVATYTTSAVHSYAVGTIVDINGMTPSGYNGYYTVDSVPTTTTFTVAITSNPGVATVFGTTTRVAHDTDDTLIENNIFSNNGLYGVRIVARAQKAKVSGNTIKECYNYGLSLGASKSNATDNFIYSNGRDGIDIETGNGTYTPLDRLTVSDNHIYNNGTRATYDGIEVQGASVNAPITNLKITDNHIFDDQETKTQRYGVIIRSGGTLTNIEVTNNNVAGNATAGILNQNASETISIVNNMGFNPEYSHALGNVSGATTFNFVNGNYQTATLTGNVTTTITSGSIIGQRMTLVLTQDGTGNWTFSTPSNVKPAGGSFVIDRTASATSSFTLFWDGTNWREPSPALGRVSGVGTSGQVLTSTGTTTLPTWQTPSKALTYVSTVVNYALTTADVVEITVSGKIVTLPDATTAVIKQYIIKNTSAGNCSFATTSSQTVDGSTTGTIIPNQALVVIPNGTNWIIV